MASKGSAKETGAETRRAALLKELKLTVKRLPTSSPSVGCSVKQRYRDGDPEFLSWKGRSSSYGSLVPAGSQDLTLWVIGDRAIRLSREYRYLLLHVNTGAVAWARVMKGKITFFERLLTCPISVAGFETRCELTALPGTASSGDHNLIAVIKNVAMLGDVHINLWFGGDSLRIMGVESSVAGSGPINNTKRWTEKNESALLDALQALLLEKFKYEDALAGIEADKFFAPEVRVRLRLAELGGRPFLLANTP